MNVFVKRMMFAIFKFRVYYGNDEKLYRYIDF